MYVKLIQPKMRMRPMDTELKTRMSPHLGLMTVAGILRDSGMVSRIEIENENIRTVTLDDRPDLVGITVTVDVLPRAVELAQKFREQGIPVVAGGIHITTAADSVPEDAFDSLIIGAAEGTWPEILQDVKAGLELDGKAGSRLKKVYRCRPDITGADLHRPAYDMMKKDGYLYCNIVSTSRGCPYRCDFCYNSSRRRRYVNRPVEDVLTDIQAIGMKHIMFIDDNFIGNPAWTRELVRAIKPMNLKWNAAVSADILDMPNLLDEMRDSGCQSLFVGFESVNPKAVEGVHKVQNRVEQYDALVEALHSRGIMINASFVFGLDGDTKETFRATLDWIIKNRIETVTSHILTPYPGTALYERMERAGRLTSRFLADYNTAHVVFQPDGMTAEELQEGYLWMYRKIYSFRNILRRMPRGKVCRKQIPAYLAFNLLYRKFGRFSNVLCRIVGFQRIGRWGQVLAHYPGKKAGKS